jgi:hypothetical protein
MRATRTVLLVAFAIATIGHAGIADASTAASSRGLAGRLDAAKLCVRVGPVRGRFKQQLGGIGVHQAWRCVGHQPTDGGSGATTIVTWAAPTDRSKRRALRLVDAGHRHACRESIGSDPARVITRYVVGDDWVAFTQINAPFRRVASVLHGHRVQKECE